MAATNGQPTPRTWAEKEQRKALWMKAVWRSHAGCSEARSDSVRVATHAPFLFRSEVAALKGVVFHFSADAFQPGT